MQRKHKAEELQAVEDKKGPGKTAAEKVEAETAAAEQASAEKAAAEKAAAEKASAEKAAAKKAAAEKAAAEEKAKKFAEHDRLLKPTKDWLCPVEKCKNLNVKGTLRCLRCNTRACRMVVCSSKWQGKPCQNVMPMWMERCTKCGTSFKITSDSK